MADVLRLAAPPTDPAYLAGVASVWAATAPRRGSDREPGVEEELVMYLPAADRSPAERQRRRGCPGAAARARPRSVRPRLTELPSPGELRLLPSVVTPELARLAAELAPSAEVLAATTSEPPMRHTPQKGMPWSASTTATSSNAARSPPPPRARPLRPLVAEHRRWCSDQSPSTPTRQRRACGRRCARTSAASQGGPPRLRGAPSCLSPAALVTKAQEGGGILSRLAPAPVR
jgi:hypothetical protein